MGRERERRTLQIDASGSPAQEEVSVFGDVDRGERRSFQQFATVGERRAGNPVPRISVVPVEPRGVLGFIDEVDLAGAEVIGGVRLDRVYLAREAYARIPVVIIPADYESAFRLTAGEVSLC